MLQKQASWFSRGDAGEREEGGGSCDASTRGKRVSSGDAVIYILWVWYLYNRQYELQRAQTVSTIGWVGRRILKRGVGGIGGLMSAGWGACSGVVGRGHGLLWCFQGH